MTIEDLIFYAASLMILSGAAGTVTLPNLLHAAISFMFCLFGTAVLFLLMNHEFVALMQIMVYVGGVVIFVVYTILLTTKLGQFYERASTWKVSVAAVLSVSCLGAVYFLLKQADLSGREVVEPPTLTEIGVRLLSSDFGGFMIPFEIISVLLLSALVGAATIARRSQDKEFADPDDVKREAGL